MLELKIDGAVDVVVLAPNAEVVTLETAGVDALFAKENPLPKEGVVAVDAVDAMLPSPNPVKDDTPLAEDVAPAETAGVVEAVAVAAGRESDNPVLPVATVEAAVVVTVENNGAEDVVNEKEPAGFEAGVAEAAEAEAEDALGNPNEG